MTYEEKTYNNLRLAALFDDLVNDFMKVLNYDGITVDLSAYSKLETRLKDFVAYFKTQAEIQEVFKRYDV